jgi:uncharacterized delta-60 repeat protein
MVRRAVLCVSLAVVAACSLAASCVAAPSDTDRTFGIRGVVTNLPQFGAVTSLIALPDGRYLGTTGGLQRSGGSDGTLFALRPRGDLDPSFGSGGIVDFAGRDLRFSTVAGGVVRQPGDRFVVWGWNPIGSPGLRLVRYTRDGTVDPTFGSDGRVEMEEGDVFDVVARPDGSLVVLHQTCPPTGSEPPCTRALFAFTADGRVDQAFGANGAVPDVSGSFVTSYPDGRIAMAAVTPSGAVSVFRYTANGSPDPEFGRGGAVLLIGPDPAAPAAMLADRDGKLIVLTNSDRGTTVVSRLMRNGALDLTFGFQGRITVKGRLTRLALQHDGKLVAAGAGEVLALFRFTRDGRLDMGFGQSGRVFTDPQLPYASVVGRVTDLVVDPDGKLVLSGAILPVVDVYPIVARYVGGPSLSPPGPRYSVHISGGGKRLQVGETIHVGLRDRLHRDQRLYVCAVPLHPTQYQQTCGGSRTGERRMTAIPLPEAGDLELRFRLRATRELILRTLHVHRR